MRVDKYRLRCTSVRILQKHWHRVPLFGAAVSLAGRCQRNDPLAIARDGYQADVRGRTFAAVLCDEIARATQFEGEIGSPENQRVTHESFGSSGPEKSLFSSLRGLLKKSADPSTLGQAGPLLLALCRRATLKHSVR